MSVGDTDFAVVSKFTYEGVSGGPGDEAAAARPITFHTSLLSLPPRFRLFRQRRGAGNDKDGREGATDAEWDERGDNDIPGYMIVDLPPVRVNVSQYKDFVGLRPGESWELRHLAATETGSAGWKELFGDSAAGDRFKFRFDGVDIDWWDWGSRDGDHAQTLLYLPCFTWGPVLQTPPSSDTTSDVCKKTENEGRPRVTIDPSEVEFSVV